MSDNTPAPKIYLAIDNSFAVKRWIKPSEWMRIIQNLGANYIEASTDNECDPLFSDKDYLADWLQEIEALQSELGMTIANFHTGYQTYRTAGLAHYDGRMRKKIIDEWFIPLIDMASRLNAGVGFSFFSMSESALKSESEYRMTEENVFAAMKTILEYAGGKKVDIIIEQMYSPMQPPWTIREARRMMEVLYKQSGFPPYITLDLGHQSGQKKCMRKTKEQIIEAIEAGRKGGGSGSEDIWFGPKTADSLFKEAVEKNMPASLSTDKISDEMDKYPYLFASREDGDTYQWLEEIGCFCPIIHMQQSDGHSSKHLPFTNVNNRCGIIDGKKVLESLSRSFLKKDGPEMPRKCENIFLTLEILYSQHDSSNKIIRDLKESVEYWRTYIPEDGIELDKLVQPFQP